jgi:hypothetical protein
MKFLMDTKVQVIIVILVIMSAALIGYFTMKKEGMESTEAPVEVPQAEAVEVKSEDVNVSAVDGPSMAEASAPQVDEELQPEELLPKSEEVKEWEAQFPDGMGDPKDKNFLVAGYNIGINTVSSSLKNANLQLRSDPYIPREDVGPWNQSTIMSSDLTNRKVLEIGSSA